MDEVFTIGVEARFTPEIEKDVDGDKTIIPATWFAVVSFAGVRAGKLAMFSVLSGMSTSAIGGWAGVSTIIDRALRHYPVDGRDINIAEGRAVSRLDPLYSNRIREWKLWVPATATLAQEGQPDQVAEGHVTGWGVGVELKGTAGYLAPYVAVQIQEEQENGQTVPMVVPARTVPPWARESRISPGDHMAESVPTLFATLRRQAAVGAVASVRCARRPAPPHYALVEDSIRMDAAPEPVPDGVIMAAAFEAAKRVRTARG